MITVAILINGNVIMSRAAVNTGKKKNGKTAYKMDYGDTILHNPEDGAIPLAKMMLDTLKAVDV